MMRNANVADCAYVKLLSPNTPPLPLQLLGRPLFVELGLYEIKAPGSSPPSAAAALIGMGLQPRSRSLQSLAVLS